MTAHLLAVSVGPVQEFIAAARRTRDLWFGSYLLSEISRAVALEVEKKGQLIFPASSNADNVANIILAEVRGSDPKVVAEAAKQAAKECWLGFAGKVLKECRGVIREDIWQQQVDDVVEFYAAWVDTTAENYQQDRARLMRLLAGRKNCRDFSRAQGRAGVPKSSLDGLRESVLSESSSARASLRLANGEQLDVVGLVKRRGEGQRPYPSVARVAADPWLRGIGASKLVAVRAACEIISAVRRGSRVYGDFPFEGTVVYANRHRDLKEEGAANDEQLNALKKALHAIDGEEPSPYLAVIVADGDEMGKTLSTLTSADMHRAFSRKLADFASAADSIIENHRGVLVYAGGDDVLAFVPVDKCLLCARALHQKFQVLTSMTLSVGLAIAHFMEPLEDLLDYGRAAEKHAKNPRAVDSGQASRDGLAVHLLKRGGGPIAVRANWTARPDEQLQELAGWINGRAISGRVAYDLHKIAKVYENWPVGSVGDAIQRDTLSVLKGKQPRGESKMPEISQFIRERVKDAASLRRLGDELLVARQIAVALRQASGQRTGEEVPG
jgi:CRISPR-associated protein Cmr2